MNPKHATQNSYHQSYLSSYNHMTESQFTHPFTNISQLKSCLSSISYEFTINLLFYQIKHTSLIFNQHHNLHFMTVTNKQWTTSQLRQNMALHAYHPNYYLFTHII